MNTTPVRLAYGALTGVSRSRTAMRPAGPIRLNGMGVLIFCVGCTCAYRLNLIGEISLAEILLAVVGVPIMLGKDVIGAIGVSGSASAQQDEEIAIAGAGALRESTAADANRGR